MQMWALGGFAATMIERPLLSPEYRLELAGAEGLVLRSERRRRRLTGELVCLIAPLIDGVRTSDELVEALAGRASAAEVYYTLLWLEQEGYVIDVAALEAGETTAFW